MKSSAQRASLCGLVVAAFSISACSGHGASSSLPPDSSGLSRAAGGHARRATSPIQHVVLLIQENRSFDNLFKGYPGANSQSYGMAVPVATCAATPAPGTSPVAVSLAPIPLEASYDIDHDHNNYNWARDGGKMDGFNRECGAVTSQPYPQYGYVPHAETKPYWSMAAQYVLADNMFQSNLDGSFIAHQYLIEGQSPNREVDYPNGVWGCVSGPSVTVHQLLPDPNPSHLLAGTKVPVCEDPQTLADELNAAGLSWRSYSVLGPPKHIGTIPSDWNGFGAVSHIYNSTLWTQNMTSGPRRILIDIAHGKLANMTWVTPTWTNSDHSAARSNTGPAWIASVVNAIGNSQFWNSTVIFVVWDDWGGWYDHVAPPQLDYDGLGFRVPLLIISPYAAQGVIAHKQLEFGSILRYIENNWSLGQLGTSDARATPVDQGCTATQPCLNYNQAPRPFKKIAAPLPPSFFIDQPNDFVPYDTQ